MKPLSTMLFLGLMACAESLDTADSGSTSTTGSGLPATLSTPDGNLLVDAGGCGDVYFTLGSADRSLVLVFSLDRALTLEAYETGTAEATVSLATAGELMLHQGTDATDFFCNDVMTQEMVIDRSWVASSGEVTVTVVSDGDKQPGPQHTGLGGIIIRDAVLSLEGAEDFTIEGVTWEARVGWLPG